MKRFVCWTLMLLWVATLGGCSSSNFAKVEDIKMAPAYWNEKQSILGIEYTNKKGGVLLSNTSSKHAKVEVKAKFYDKDSNYIDEDLKSLTLTANGDWFVFFDIDDKVADIKYSVETDKVFWEPAAASDITFEFDYENGEVIVMNGSDKNTRMCSLQYVYYDKSGNILYVDGVTVNDGYIPAGEKVAEDYSLEYPAYLDEYENLDVCIYCVYE